MWQGMLEIMSISSFLSEAQMAEKQIFFTDIKKIFQLQMVHDFVGILLTL